MGPELNKEILDQLVSQMKQTLDTIYKLKESKRPNCEWEVVAYRFKSYNTREGNYVIIDQNSLHWIPAQEDTEHYEIFSVKRLSDNEIFSLGDKVTYLPVNKIHWVIDNFHVTVEGKMLARSESNANVEEVNEYLGKVKQILFTTEDGELVYKDQSFYYVDKQFRIHIYSADSAWTPKEDGLEFSTREKAEEWLLWNKPILTLNDVKECSPYTPDDNPHYIKIIQIAKAKLNLK